MTDQPTQNDQLVLVCGQSATGKSASLRNIRTQDRWLYLNTEAGKRLPFRNQFKSFNITDPYQVFDAFEAGAASDKIDGAILDTLTFWFDMMESQYVIPSPNTQQAWGEFAQIYKRLMQTTVASFGKPVIITAHTKDDLDEASHSMKTAVPVKGSLRNNGIEALVK